MTSAANLEFVNLKENYGKCGHPIHFTKVPNKKGTGLIQKQRRFNDGSWRWRDRWMLTWGTHFPATSFHGFQVFLQLIFSHLLDEIHRNSASVCRDYPRTRNINFISLSCNTYKHVYYSIYIAPYTTRPIHELRSRTRWVFQIEANSSNVVISARAPNSKNLGSMISGILVEGASHSATSWVSS